MRNGALITGSITCNSSPVDMRGAQFVPGAGFRYCENVRLWPPTQLNEISSAGHPNNVVLMSLSWPEFMRNCDCRTIGSPTTSMKGAKVTGPTIAIRYSTLPNVLKSPPGCTMDAIATGIWYGPWRGLFGFFRTTVPSGFVKLTTVLLGRNAIGEIDRISNPGTSLSAPM